MRETAIGGWSGILVYIQCRKGKIHPVGKELIGEAWRLAGKSGMPIFAAAIGSNLEQAATQLKKYPLKELYLYEAQDEYHPVIYEKILTQCIETTKPSIVLIGGTLEGRALAPRLSVAFESGLTADCTSLEMDNEGNLVQIRPAFGGNIMASIVTPFTRPQFATVRPGVMSSDCSRGMHETKIIRNRAALEDETFQILEVQEPEKKDTITNAEILVVAGRGIKKKEDLGMIRELADLLGGKMASSRALVEKGWVSQKIQVGLSGNTVSPEFMITCGVSGTVQFMAGMKNTKNIIAVNTDPEAPIFRIAHYPVCGDLYEIVPEMIERLKRKKGDGSAGA